MSEETPPPAPPPPEPVAAEPAPPTPPPAPTPAERAEAAATRRRWINLGEFVAVAGLLIALAGLLLNWLDRRDAQQQRVDDQRSAKSVEDAAQRRVGLVATGKGGSTLGIRASACTLQATDISFPRALGADAQSVMGEGAIRADWIAGPMLKLTDGGADRRTGRLPVLIASRCEGVDGPRAETAIYDLAWRIEPHLFGRGLTVQGLVFRENVSGDGQRRLDGMWTKP